MDRIHPFLDKIQVKQLLWLSVLWLTLQSTVKNFYVATFIYHVSAKTSDLPYRSNTFFFTRKNIVSNLEV